MTPLIFPNISRTTAILHKFDEANLSDIYYVDEAISVLVQSPANS